MGPVSIPESRIEVASYRDVFDLERRLYRLDRLRLNPGGVPLRGVLYFVAAVLAAAALSAFPVAGRIVRLLPWYLRYGGMPGMLAALGCGVRVAGRPLHLALRGLASRVVRPRQLSAFSACMPIGERWRPPPVIVIADGSGPRVRGLRFTGPGVVVVRRRHLLAEWRVGTLGRGLRRPDLSLHVANGRERGRAVAVGSGIRLDVSPLRPGEQRAARG